jgi:hypothetical protein
MSNYDLAKIVLKRAQEEIIRELAICGQNGGTGRAQSYAPILVTLTKAIEVVESLDKPTVKVKEVVTATVDRMAKVRAAKAAKALEAE